jgi:hypothetical protein
VKRPKVKFTGAIRLVDHVDTIGVPVFADVNGNRMFVPETDGDLRIGKFVDFYNEDGFHIDYNPPQEFRNQVFELGASVPIPFWVGGVSHVIIGDADKGVPEQIFGRKARTNPVLRDIARLLDDARSGRIQDRFDEWAAESLAAAYSDVFYEQPSRSRYWVSRYRVAVAEARKLSNPPHPVDTKLRSVASEWLKLFGSKSDIRKLVGILGNPKNEIFSRRQFTDVLFAFLVNKYAANEMGDIDVYIEESALHVVFPAGLYGHYLEHGWPRVPFKYEQDEEFIAHAMEELVNANESQYFVRAAKVIFLLFGRAELPNQVDELARAFLQRAGVEFRRYREDWDKVPMAYEHRLITAQEMLRLYDEMLEIDSIMIGKERLRRKPADGRFGVGAKLLRDLKELVADSRLV